MKSWLSASDVPRALACTASVVLPAHDYRTEHADAGSGRHSEMEDAVDRGDIEALPEVVQRYIKPGYQLACELSFAYDIATDTARVLGRTKRDYAAYGLKPYELPGTPDLIIIGDGRAVVVDYKSFEEVDDADENEQTMMYALMVARTYGYSEVTVVIVYLVANRRPTIATVGRLDFDLLTERLRKLQADAFVARSTPEQYVNPGSHCKYCRSFHSCPAQSALQRQASSGAVALRIESSIPFHDDVSAADAYELLSQLRMMTKRLTAALYARAAERPIPLGDGRVFGPRPVQGDREIDGDIAYRIVRELHGQDVADAAVTRDVSQASIKRALRPIAGKGKLAAMERQVMEMIYERDGVKRQSKTEIAEHVPVPMLRVVNE